MCGYLDAMAGAAQIQAREAAAPRLLTRRLDFACDAERAFVHIYGASANAFWLDSSAAGERGRFSFMGDSGGPLGAVVTYDVAARRTRVERATGVDLRRESIFDYLNLALARIDAVKGREALGDALPFDFDCGFTGYLGYELKADCGGDAAHRAATPDAALVFADRLIAFDHREGHTYLLALVPSPELHQVLHPPGGELDAVRLTEEAEGWIGETVRRLGSLPPLPPPARLSAPVELRLRRGKKRYLDDVEACKRYLQAGHSYEICLTDKVVAEAELDPLALYRSLRRVNPAPFAAYLRFGELAVLSSSPERFLAIDRAGRAEARPIKGTKGRGGSVEEDTRAAAALGADEKSRAENVTIVDLLRNDLGRVCEIGTVDVPEMMRVESCETVHQLVSSVRGRLRPGTGPVACVEACFPPGSMTGAPKLRTMQIIDELEGEARGVYAGAIGYLGTGGGCDFSVAIRTIVLDGTAVSIGAGGAIVLDSDPGSELAEMLLKAAAPAAALNPHAPVSFAPSAAPEHPGRRALFPLPTS
jgi:para-aminobenzoate synthetase